MKVNLILPKTFHINTNKQSEGRECERDETKHTLTLTLIVLFWFVNFWFCFLFCFHFISIRCDEISMSILIHYSILFCFYFQFVHFISFSVWFCLFRKVGHTHKCTVPQNIVCQITSKWTINMISLKEREREKKEPCSKWDEETYTLNNNKLFVFGVATTTTTAI